MTRMVVVTATLTALLAATGCADLGGPAGPDPGPYDVGDYGPYDQNRDFALDRTEYETIAATFAIWDDDADGVLDRDEFNAFYERNWGPAGPESVALFDAWDDNDDGILGPAEFGGADEFVAWDTDRNDMLDADEGWF